MAEPWPDGWGRLILARTDSTNAEIARRPEPAPVWCMAHEQTAGVGRRGRAWSFMPGNFAASVRIAPDGDLAGFARYSFVAALALHDALSAAIGSGGDLALKWPNDVLLGGRKICGILLETVRRDGGAELVAGFGVNLARAPGADSVETGAVPPGSVAELTGATVEPEAFLDLLAPAFARRAAQMQAAGFDAIRADWMARAAGVGTRIVARLPRASHEGIFEDIDAEGALVLRTEDARLVLPAADVYLAPGNEGRRHATGH